MSMSTYLTRLIELLEKNVGDIEIISYGLAPNPNGFCYELYDNVDAKDLKEIDTLLELLSSEDVQTLRELYL